MKSGVNRQFLIETIVVVSFIVAAPVLANTFRAKLVAVVEPLGNDLLVQRLSGNVGWTDVGWEVASARALIEPGYFAYDSLGKLNEVMPMGWFTDQAQSHPPFGIPPFLILAYIPYNIWLPLWISSSIVAIAISMRALGVPAWFAYPAALGTSFCFAGQYASLSTYPLGALLLSLAWRWRRRPLLGGLTLAGFGLGRGVGLLLLAYPLVKRRFKLLVISVSTVAVSSLVAVALEPGVFGDFLTYGRLSIERNLLSGNNVTLLTVLGARGIPSLVIYIFVGLTALRAIQMQRSLFWILVWVSFAITPIGWYHTPILAVPLLVTVWQMSTLGRVIVILSAGVFAATTNYMSYAWLFIVLGTALALMWGRAPKSIASTVSEIARWRPYDSPSAALVYQVS